MCVPFKYYTRSETENKSTQKILCCYVTHTLIMNITNATRHTNQVITPQNEYFQLNDDPFYININFLVGCLTFWHQITHTLHYRVEG